MKGVRLTTARLIVRDLPPAAGGRVARFHAASRPFHRPWEPHRREDYFTPGAQRSILRSELRSESIIHLWLLLRDAERRRAGWRSLPIAGSVTISSIVRGFVESGYLGYKMDSRHTRRGYMREALQCVIAHAFDSMGLHRLEADIMPRNEASLRLVRSLGFREEGIARSYLLIQGVWEDHLRMVLLNDAWGKNPSCS